MSLWLCQLCTDSVRVTPSCIYSICSYLARVWSFVTRNRAALCIWTNSLSEFFLLCQSCFGTHRYSTFTFMSHHIQVRRVQMFNCRRSLSLTWAFTCAARSWSGLTNAHDFYVAEGSQTNTKPVLVEAQPEVNMVTFIHFLVFLNW